MSIPRLGILLRRSCSGHVCLLTGCRSKLQARSASTLVSNPGLARLANVKARYRTLRASEFRYIGKNGGGVDVARITALSRKARRKWYITSLAEFACMIFG